MVIQIFRTIPSIWRDESFILHRGCTCFPDLGKFRNELGDLLAALLLAHKRDDVLGARNEPANIVGTCARCP
jgi:hypothetical protein